MGLHARGEPRASACRRSRPTAPASAAGCASRAWAERAACTCSTASTAPTSRSSPSSSACSRQLAVEPPDRDALARRCREAASQRQWSRLAPRVPRGVRARARRGGDAGEPQRGRTPDVAGRRRPPSRATVRPRRSCAPTRSRGRCRRRSRAWSGSRATIWWTWDHDTRASVRGALARALGGGRPQPDPLPARHLTADLAARAADRLRRSSRARAGPRFEAYFAAAGRRRLRCARDSRARRRSPTSAPSSASNVAADLQRRPRRARRRPPQVGQRPRPAAGRRRPLLPPRLPAPARSAATASRSAHRRSTIRAPPASSWCADENGEPARGPAAVARRRARAARCGARWSAACRSTCSTPTCRVNRPEDRDITHFLYGGDNEMRLRQEIVLGRGGVRLLRAARPRAGRVSTSTRVTRRSRRSSAWRGWCARAA